MRMSRPLLLACLLAPLLSLTACDEVSGLFNADAAQKEEEAETKARRSFAERPRPAHRLDTEGVEEAFMVEAPETAARLGWGWSMPRGQIIPTVCVEFEDPPAMLTDISDDAQQDNLDKAQTTSLSVKEVRDSSELSKSMKVSSSVSVKTIGYQASGKAKFAKDTKVSSFSTTIVVEAEVRNPPYAALPKASSDSKAGPAVRLTADKAALARRDPEAFQEICGEGYVSTLMTGAEAYAVIEVKTSSRTEKETMSASLKGEGMGVKVKAAFGSSSGSASDSYTRDITFYQAGGSGNDLPLPRCADDTKTEATCPDGQMQTDREVIMDRIRNLAKDANAAPKTFALEVTPYQVLENFPRGAELAADAGETDEIAVAYGLYRTVYDDIAGAMAAAEMGPAAKEHAHGAVGAALLEYTIPVAVCSGSALADCKVEMMDLGAKDVGGSDKTGVTTLDLLGALQDIALIARDQIEIGAADCLIAEEDCEFDLASLRSVYAARTGMPVPKGWVPSMAFLADHTALHLRGPAHARCAVSSLEPGCISNAEIAGWVARSGFAPVTATDEAAFARVTAALQAGGVPYLEGDADRPDALTVWVPPAHLIAAQTALQGPQAAL